MNGSWQVLDWYVYTRFVAIRSREGKHFRHAGSAVAESRPIFIACGATRQFDHSDAGDRPHVTICSFGVVNRAVTSNATLRPPADSSLSPIPSDRL